MMMCMQLCAVRCARACMHGGCIHSIFYSLRAIYEDTHLLWQRSWPKPNEITNTTTMIELRDKKLIGSTTQTQGRQASK